MSKPMIRHCKNCEYNHQTIPSNLNNGICLVKYSVIFNARKKAIFCKYYKQKEVNECITEK